MPPPVTGTLPDPDMSIATHPTCFLSFIPEANVAVMVAITADVPSADKTYAVLIPELPTLVTAIFPVEVVSVPLNVLTPTELPLPS